MVLRGNATLYGQSLNLWSWIRLPGGEAVKPDSGAEGLSVRIKTAHLPHVIAPKFWQKAGGLLRWLAPVKGMHMPLHIIGTTLFGGRIFPTDASPGFDRNSPTLCVKSGLARVPGTLSDGLLNGIRHFRRPAPVRHGGLDGSFVVAASHVVLAASSQVIAALIDFTLDLHVATQQRLAHVPTWMAGQGKAVAVYDRAFGATRSAIRGRMLPLSQMQRRKVRCFALRICGFWPLARRQRPRTQLVTRFVPDAVEPVRLVFKVLGKGPACRRSRPCRPLRMGICSCPGTTEAAPIESGFLGGVARARRPEPRQSC
ncbi:MAG: hypothetical protein GDA36_01805 [Rhodobacteraceae bacterium]|nr:hypothetical protein [Paracoccaceae bacterium]